jgi:hypothetical protein
MTNLSNAEVDQQVQGGFGAGRSAIGSVVPSGAGGGALSSVEGAGREGEAGLASVLGGGLQKAYILILPPFGGASGAMAAAAGIAAEDLAGGEGGSSMQAMESSVSGVVGNRVELFFNPTQYTVSKSATWTHSPDQGSYPTAPPQYVGAGQRQLSLEVFLDASYTTDGSVQGAVDLLFSTVTPSRASIFMETPSPPYVLFGWGENLGFLAYMETVSAEFSHFRGDGTPIRASCKISMKEIPIGLASQNPTSGGGARRTRRTVAGDTLQSVSYSELGKPTMWRAIAASNDIEDPTRVPHGTTLLIPPKADAAGMA